MATESATRPLLDMRGISKRFGAVQALTDIQFDVGANEVVALVGDNGAGKSTLIKIIAGLHDYTSGRMSVNGEERHFSSPRDSLDSGIATVYQDLALAPLMSVWRNFFLGNEITTGPFRKLDSAEMKRIAQE